ncbi:hypothetical protein QE152_g20833 [Popillia japonica]|uniref:Uncharacterized protein n=1 Tax=Popillia japonica TaxID=7064 RepID=A0AAW1KLU5_POPJA
MKLAMQDARIKRLQHAYEEKLRDESRFNLRSPDGREKNWRRRGERYSQCCIFERSSFGDGGVMVWAGVCGERYSQCCIFERSSFGDGGVMVWAGVCMNARTELVFIDGYLTADRSGRSGVAYGAGLGVAENGDFGEPTAPAGFGGHHPP